jgi:hypothetical protein
MYLVTCNTILSFKVFKIFYFLMFIVFSARFPYMGKYVQQNLLAVEYIKYIVICYIFSIVLHLTTLTASFRKKKLSVFVLSQG